MEKQRKTRDRSSFSLTCSLLSQYLKEKRSYGNLGIERLHSPLEMEKDLFRPPTTMNLFPGSIESVGNRNELESDKVSEQMATMSTDLSAQLQGTDAILKDAKRGDQKKEENNGQLTIFYDGKVMVFDNFPSKKAKELMEMAIKGKSVLPNSGPAPALQQEPSSSVDLTMPIARRASLHRFLEKRKDRIDSIVPYFVRGSSECEAMPIKLEMNKNMTRITP